MPITTRPSRFGRTRSAAAVAPSTNERSSDPDAAREAALAILERARRTRHELNERLLERGFTAAAIEPTLDRLAAVGLVDDVEYARAFLDARMSRRTAGWRRLEMELKRRGVRPEDIAAARSRLEESRGGLDDAAAASRVLDQVARRYAKLHPRARRQRLYALLARRGFDGGVIARVLKLRDGEGTIDEA